MATATAEPSVIDLLKKASVEDLMEVQKLLGGAAVQPPPQTDRKARWNPEENLPPDQPLATPIRFWNAKYPEVNLRIPGRTKASKFWAGSFLAKTERELTAARNSLFAREGDDLEKPRLCPHCQWPCWNTAAADDHIRFQHPTA